jgi:DNA-binding PadR family transcriptional regulator
MRDEGWGDPREGHGHRGHARGRVRMRGGPGGPGPWGPGPFQYEMRGGPFGPPRFKGPGGRGPRVRRGDVRAAILDLLSEGQSWNGYQIIQEIGERTQGVWRPSAGSVYPALQQLEDEGLIQAEAGEDRRRNYTLTDEGRAYVESHRDQLRASWDASPAQVQQANKILADTRKALYRILAADDEGAEEDTQG